MSQTEQTETAKQYFTRDGHELTNVVITKQPSAMETFFASAVDMLGIKNVFGYRVSRVVGKGSVVDGLDPNHKRSAIGAKHFAKIPKKKQTPYFLND